MNPRAKEIGLAWVQHVRACVTEGLSVELLEHKYRITQLYIQNFTSGVWQ